MENLIITKASEVIVKEVEWLWYPYIPYGKVTVLQGDSGDGKSTFVLKLAAMLSRGEPMQFTDGAGQEPVNVIYIAPRIRLKQGIYSMPFLRTSTDLPVLPLPMKRQ